VAHTTIKDQVTAAAEQLRGMSTQELYNYAVHRGWDNRSAFARFKSALADNDIVWVERKDRLADKAKDLASKDAPTIIMYTDAASTHNRFAICDQDGEPIWYGQFFEGVSEQSEAELEAAKKALWLANKIKEDAGLDVLRLELRTDAEWLTWANVVAEGDPRGGKARELGARAVRLGIALFVQHIPGVNNPADSYTRTSGFLKWNESIKKVESLLQVSPKPSVDSSLVPRVESEKPYVPGTSRSAWG